MGPALDFLRFPREPEAGTAEPFPDGLEVEGLLDVEETVVPGLVADVGAPCVPVAPMSSARSALSPPGSLGWCC